MHGKLHHPRPVSYILSHPLNTLHISHMIVNTVSEVTNNSYDCRTIGSFSVRLNSKAEIVRVLF